FSYYELYLAVSHVVRNFRIRLVDASSPPSISACANSRFHPVQLPPRREWVAAVPTQKMLVVFEERREERKEKEKM
ncbi:hypothetical protein DIS24_g12620, partial [Lasiodiplodia hormozganensis]